MTSSEPKSPITAVSVPNRAAQQPGELAPLAYRPADAADVLGISRAKLYQLMDEGRIVGRKLDRRTLILRSELERYIASLPVRELPG